MSPFQQKSLRALLFDKDGTVLDFDRSWTRIATEAAIAAAAHRPALVPALLQACGLDPSTGRFRAGSAMVAGTAADVAACWAPLLGRVDRGALTERIDAEFTRGAHGMIAVEGAAEALGALRAAGWSIGLATMDNEAAAETALQHLGLRGLFDFVCGWDSGHGVKPGPGMALAFCAAVGVPPPAAVMVGDSVHDLAMASAAGMGMRVGVLTGPATAEMLAPHADLVVESIAALPAFLGAAAR